MAYSNRIWVYGPVGLLGLLALLYSVFWRVEADMLAARLDRANGGEIMPGVLFAFAGKSIGGFPFRLDTLLDGVSFEHDGPEGPTAWRAEKLALHALTYGRPLYIFEAAGLQSFEWTDPSGGPPRLITLTPGVARASAILRNGKLARFDLDLWQPLAKDASQGADAARTLSAARAQLHLLHNSDNSVEVAVKIDEARLGEGYRPALGGDIAVLDLRGKLSAGESLTSLTAGAESVFDGTEHWRQSGGKLDVQKLTLRWAGLKTDLQGALGLDGFHRPDGTLRGSIDAGEIVSALTGGKLNLSAANTPAATVSLQFKDGDITLAAGSAFIGGASR
jgi:hypothetical protein